MTEQQIIRYLDLVDRRLYILTHSGVDWKSEYGPELKQIDKEIAELRQVVDAAHEEKECETMTKQTYSAGELAELLGVSESLAYRYIRQMNAELAQKGYLTVRGRISRAYAEERFFGAGMKEQGAMVNG